MVFSSAGAASKFALSAVGAAAVMGLSACQVGGTGTYSGGSGGSGGSAGSGDSSSAGSGAAQPAAAGGQAPAAAGSGAGSGGGVGRCTAADLSVEIIDQGPVAGAQTASWLLTAANTSHHTCAVNGYPSFGLQGASGSLWADSHTTYVRHPGAPVRIVLKPGRNAFAGVKWPVCDSGDLVGGLVMTPPGDTAHVKVAVHTDSDSARLKLFRVCGHSVTAGSLQPATQGVVFAS